MTRSHGSKTDDALFTRDDNVINNVNLSFYSYGRGAHAKRGVVVLGPRLILSPSEYFIIYIWYLSIHLVLFRVFGGIFQQNKQYRLVFYRLAISKHLNDVHSVKYYNRIRFYSYVKCDN